MVKPANPPLPCFIAMAKFADRSAEVFAAPNWEFKDFALFVRAGESSVTEALASNPVMRGVTSVVNVSTLPRARRPAYLKGTPMLVDNKRRKAYVGDQVAHFIRNARAAPAQIKAGGALAGRRTRTQLSSKSTGKGLSQGGLTFNSSVRGARGDEALAALQSKSRVSRDDTEKYRDAMETRQAKIDALIKSKLKKEGFFDEASS